jgi:hypothetical protein
MLYYIETSKNLIHYPTITYYWTVPLTLDHSNLVGKLSSSKDCRYESVRMLEVLKLLFQQFLNLSSSQRDMSGPILGTLSNGRWSWGIHWQILVILLFLNLLISFKFLTRFSWICPIKYDLKAIVRNSQTSWVLSLIMFSSLFSSAVSNKLISVDLELIRRRLDWR